MSDSDSEHLFVAPMMEMKITKKEILSESIGSIDSKASSNRPFIILDPMDDSRINNDQSIEIGMI